MFRTEVIVSVIIPVHNGALYLDECLESIEVQVIPATLCSERNQCSRLKIEVSIYDDASTDDTPLIVERWKERLLERKPCDIGYRFGWVSGRNDTDAPKGVGFAKNRAIEQSSGDFLCFCDADDVMMPERIWKQHEAAARFPDAIIGAKFTRLPEESTQNYTHWANSLSQDQLTTQLFTTFGPTVIMPTWFCHRATFDKVRGAFSELSPGFPEDLDFFYRHLNSGGPVHRVDVTLIKYRYHGSSTTFSVLDHTIRSIRLNRLESTVLQRWPKFGIWNAGKLGRRFYRDLSPYIQSKVSRFYDIDQRKILYGFYKPTTADAKIPILHVSKAVAPLVICVKTELTFDPHGPFQLLLSSLYMKEGVDYFFFN